MLMREWTALSALRLVLLTLLAYSLALGPPTLSSANQKQQKESKKSTSQDRQDYYQKWLKEDVLYIITDDERKVFQSLSTPEEKDAFIEQFWSRRDPDPRTPNNEFKEEHYRRIAYANEN